MKHAGRRQAHERQRRACVSDAAHRQPRDLRKVRWYGHNDLNATACPGSFKTMYVSKGAKR